MSEKKARNPIWWILGFSGTAIMLLLASSYHGWNARNRPPLISGSWYMDELQTEEIEHIYVKFSQSGGFEFDGDTGYGMRWRFSNGKLFLRSWRLKSESELARRVTNTTLYSWFADADETKYTTEISEDGSVLTLIAEDHGPHLRFRRVKP